MKNDLIEEMGKSRLTRRKIVTTGTKLAYAAPLVAASTKFSSFGASAGELLEVYLCGDPRNEFCTAVTDLAACKVIICHRTCSDTNPYVAIEVSSEQACTSPDAGLQAHIEKQHNDGKACDVFDKLPSNITEIDNKKFADCGGGVSPVSPV